MNGKLENKPAIKYRDIRFMQYMINHVEKSYPELFEFITEIAKDHDDICNTIHDIMKFYTPITRLKATKQKRLPEDNNIYISDHIFLVVFNTVDSNESSIVLHEVPINDNRTRL